MSDVQQQANAAKNTVRSDVAASPIKAILIAGAVGLVIGQIVALFLHF